MAVPPRDALVAELERARLRTLGLVELPDEEQRRQQSPLMSPLVWDLAHVGNYEELWLVRAVGGRQPIDPTLDGIYDAFRHPRPNRPILPLLGPTEARGYISEVRGRALDVLHAVELDGDDPLLADGFAVGLVVQHEHQHDETMLATRQLMGERATLPVGTLPPPPLGRYDGPAEVFVPGGRFVMGTDLEPWAYDNERPAHPVDVDPFWIDAAAVTNAAYAEFIADGGYREPAWWTDEGWAWRQEAGLEHPEFWAAEGEGAWRVLRFGAWQDVVDDEPVQHVCWYEADAYARWAGRRLPTETEWEVAAAGSDKHHANLGQRWCGPTPAGTFPEGASEWGCQQMLGDVWEWTVSDFTPYPGFRSFPYREYSEVFFGSDYKVLRGGSWATHPLAIRTTFRNWDYPIRRQIFAGFRCARDA